MRCARCGAIKTGSGSLTVNPDGTVTGAAKNDSHCMTCGWDHNKSYTAVNGDELADLIEAANLLGISPDRIMKCTLKALMGNCQPLRALAEVKE